MSVDRFFIIPANNDLNDQEKAALEPDILGTFFPDSQRWAMDRSMYVIGYIPTTGTPQSLQGYTEYTAAQAVQVTNRPPWVIPMF